ncbi:class I adenylate-forming enzyme family protein [Nitrosopumilus sp.]|uniref:class I adenylate-forming enzyme family protein n=1 Tax=Nitrosopumilus sp. TaxID=2024843 RepID=UPI003D0BF474
MIDSSQLSEHQKIKNQIDLEYENIGELFSKKVNETPDKIFLICPGKGTDEFTFIEFKKLLVKSIQYFKSIGLKKGEKISLVFHNSPEFLILYFTGLILGITIVPINPDISSREIKYIVEDSDTKLIFFDEKLELKINELNQFFPSEKFVKIKSIYDFDNSYEQIELDFKNNVSINDLAVIIYTSGTTGNPKGVKLSHMNLLADAKSISEWFCFNKETRTLCILPLFHNNGQITTLLAPLYAGGSTIIVKGKVSLYSFWDLVNQYKATWTSVMASILSILLSLPKNRKDKTLNAILCGGQVLTRTVQNEFEKRFFVPIFEGYGLTETTSFSCINNYPAEKRKFGSIGKALLTNEMEILDEKNCILESNVEGEICIKGYNVTEGYLGLEERNKKSFQDGWFHSGDYGRKDENGYFYIHGRKDSLIIKGGENIYPSELENILYKHPDIDECAVIGIPDKLLGEEICAFIKIKKNKKLDENEIKEFCKNKIANYKQPKKVFFINNLIDLDDIPKGPTKKVLYRELKNYYITKCKINENSE